MMNINDNKLWNDDLDEVIASLPDIDLLAGSNVLITGSTGLICSAVVDVLIRWNLTHDKKINIFAAARNQEKLKNCFGPHVSEPWFNFVYYDASSDSISIPDSMDYIIHGASNASPNHIVAEPVETMLSNFAGMKLLLDYAKEQKTKRVLYISSSEVYGRKDTDLPSKITDYGWIDILNPRSCYSSGKCAAETLCASYYD
jgi:nucleoside-diphosphate-sugar epimerase